MARKNNPGKRERVARKRHKRTVTYNMDDYSHMSEQERVLYVLNGSDPKPCKLGREHFVRRWRRTLTVADSRKPPSPMV